MVSPQDFIGIAEESGLILPIGEWVLRAACQQVKRWHDEGLGQVKLAVNLSTKQFRHSRLKETLTGILAETGFEPRYLEVEIPESVLMESNAAVSEVLATSRLWASRSQWTISVPATLRFRISSVSPSTR